jgi:uncharacterized protein
MTPKPFRILSLNGGGVRGIFQASYLAKLETLLGKPIHNYFDLIAGTSTGAIVGLAIALKIDTQRIADFYRQHASDIFRPRIMANFRRGPRYKQDLLRQHLTDLFGSKQLRDASTAVLITASSLDQFGHRVFSNSPELGFNDEGLSVVDVALASAAAPTYFRPVKPAGQQRSYLDGGLWANSPSALAILKTHRHLGVPLESMRLLSVATGDFPNGMTPESLEALRPISPAAIRTLFEVMFSSQASFADSHAEELLPRDNVIRVSASLEEAIPLVV